jgi:hypothetical protein
MEPARCNPETNPKTKKRLNPSILLGMGWELAITVGLFVGGGWLLARELLSTWPLVVLAFLGLGIGLFRFLFVASRLDR